MLKHLSIKNYALIQELNISPSDKLNIITGETGAGKSIMLGAVGLLLGNRADSKALLQEDQKCVIEGKFDISNYQLKALFNKEDLDFEPTTIIRREITPAGKSRAFVNDTPVILETLKKLGVKLMDVHSQHETLQLSKNNFQLKFIDVYAGTLSLREEYALEFRIYKNILDELSQLVSENEQASKEDDYNRFLLDELVKLDLKEDEQEPLEKSVKLMEHAEEIKLKLNESLQILNQDEYAITNSLQTLMQALNQLSKLGDTYQQIAERVNSAVIELNDIASEIEREEERVNFDPQQALDAQERLSEIYRLQQKHQVLDIPSLLQIQLELEAKVSRSASLDDKITQTKTQLENQKNKCQQLGDELSKRRKASFYKLSNELLELLSEVGMPDASIEFKHSIAPLDISGCDEIIMLFSANKGIAPEELAKVASGGEFSRLMFCIKFILAAKVSLPTIIFDEIDTGVSGEIAIKMGVMMKKMAENHQVITISHLPQIAAKGDTHYFVYKDNTSEKAISKIRALENEDRIMELAKMLGGENPSEVAYKNAQELISS